MLQFNTGLEKNKLFLKGLPLTATKSELEELFAVVRMFYHKLSISPSFHADGTLVDNWRFVGNRVWCRCHRHCYCHQKVCLMSLTHSSAACTILPPLCCSSSLTQLVILPLPGHMWDVMLVWRNGNINKSCLCARVFCIIIMVRPVWVLGTVVLE